jgi:hypothetical protein
VTFPCHSSATPSHRLGLGVPPLSESIKLYVRPAGDKFGPFWCNLLSKLLKSSSTRVLVNNGEPGDLICHQCGLRQGDMLSPMLFILVMDILNSLISKASEQGLLQPIMRQGHGQRVSIYADDVVLFLKPCMEELFLVKEILKIFGTASGLVMNVRKCSITPIQCEEQDMEVQDSMPCNVVEFPCKYLGLPLSSKKLAKNDFLSLIDRIADYLQGSKVVLMHPTGRVALIRVVLTAVPIHHFIVVQCPKWVHKAINKIINAFLWKGHREVKGGHCLVGWERVCRPLDLGGLRILNLETLSWALHMRWLWLRKTQPDRPWTELNIQVHPNVSAMFSSSVISVVGDGTATYFWTGRWLHHSFQGVRKASLRRRLGAKAQLEVKASRRLGKWSKATL